MFGKLFKSKKEQVKLFYNTDVHCHILPGVDHGSQSVEQSLEMLKAEAEMGIHRVILTSHVTAVTFENTRETLTDAFMKLKDAVTDAGIDMELYLSAEYRMDEYFDKEYAADHLIPMPGNHILLENSFQQELMNLDDLLFDMQVKGYSIPTTPVAANATSSCTMPAPVSRSISCRSRATLARKRVTARCGLCAMA